MIPAAFDYKRPATVDEAVALLQEFGDDAKILSGGHSLLPTMKLRFNTPAVLIDIGRLESLSYIREQDGMLHIGANTTHRDLETSQDAARCAPALAESAALIGDPQVRNRGTVGGSLAHADPAADYPAPLLVHGAVIKTRGPDGERAIDAEDFFQELYMTALEPEEIITGIRVPVQAGDVHSCYEKFPHPASRFAVVGCAVSVRLDNGTCRDVKVAFNGLANAAFLDEDVASALEGKVANADNVFAAAAHAAQNAEVNGDAFADEDYRRHLAHVFARRALMRALGL